MPKDYVEAMWLMLQQDEPEDYVVATGVAHSVRRVRGDRLRPGRSRVDDHVVIDESLTRPAEVDHLIGDAARRKRELGWEPRTSFEELIRLMVDADYELLGGVGRRTAQLARARSELKPGADSARGRHTRGDRGGRS